MASSPMKKSRSSMPRLVATLDPPGFDGTEGREALEELAPPPEERVAIAVGNTKDGSELPAHPAFVKPVPLSLSNA